jgi:UV DNA damage endonuclease
MRLGFAVKVLGEGGLPSHDSRRWQSGPHLSTSLERLREVLRYLDRHDIRMYRMATALAPYASHPDLPQFHGQVAECAAELAEVGALARDLDVRLSTHPGQYTVLNSERPEVRAAAAADLEVQAALLDAMGLGPEAVVVLHVGGGAGGRLTAADRFLAAFEALGDRARERLVIENDDRVFGLADVLSLSERTGLRVVFDVHHHHCHDPEGMGDREALELALGTWPADVTPKVHFSSPRPELGGAGMRRHADLIDPDEFEAFLHEAAPAPRFDVMLEAKAKDLALLRLRGELAARGILFPA